MVRIVVDANILIDFLRNGSGDFPQLMSLQERNEVKLYLPTIVILELFLGQSSKKTGGIINALIGSFQLVPLGVNLAQFAGEEKRDSGVVIDTADLIIAATALSLDAFLATRNRKHFQKIPGLKFFKLPK